MRDQSKELKLDEKLMNKVDNIYHLIDDEILRRFDKQNNYYDHNNDHVRPIIHENLAIINPHSGSNYTNLDQSEPSELRTIRLENSRTYLEI